MKTILVVGASKGIGKAIVMYLNQITKSLPLAVQR
jgi:short-subunit dehydrogenase